MDRLTQIATISLYPRGHHEKSDTAHPQAPWEGEVLALASYDAAEKCPMCGAQNAKIRTTRCATPQTPPVRCFYQTINSREADQWRRDDRRHTQTLIPQVKLKD